MSGLERAILEYLNTDDHIDHQKVVKHFAANELIHIQIALQALLGRKLVKIVDQDDMKCLHLTALGLDALRPSPRENDDGIPF